LNGNTWYINSLGKNKLFYYITVTNDTDSIDYTFDANLIDIILPELPQIYNWILTQPEFAGASLINS
jgi:hypothetical protein